MTKKKPADVSASVRQKLLNAAHAQKLDFQRALGEYAAQRTLWRLEHAGFRDVLIFKGGRLLNVWLGRFRGTRDMDFSSHHQMDESRLRALFARVCDVVEEDGLRFDKSNMAIEGIRHRQTFQGMRLTMNCYLGQARIPLQIDVGFNLEVSPGEHIEEVPSIIDRPIAHVMAYSPHAVIGEKTLAAVIHGEYNSRMKDFFDIALLARRCNFSGSDIASGLRAAFNQEKIAIPEKLTLNIHEGETRWNAFLRKAAVIDQFSYVQLCKEVEAFINPCLTAMHRQEEHRMSWKAGSSWFL